jgi:hypothetical protein
MLILIRKSGESLYLTLSDDISSQTPIGDVLGGKPIVIQIPPPRE